MHHHDDCRIIHDDGACRDEHQCVIYDHGGVYNGSTDDNGGDIIHVCDDIDCTHYSAAVDQHHGHTYDDRFTDDHNGGGQYDHHRGTVHHRGPHHNVCANDRCILDVNHDGACRDEHQCVIHGAANNDATYADDAGIQHNDTTIVRTVDLDNLRTIYDIGGRHYDLRVAARTLIDNAADRAADVGSGLLNDRIEDR